MTAISGTKTWLQPHIISIDGEEILLKCHPCSHCNILCSQLCRCESSLAGWTGGICLVVFKAEVLVSFRKPHSSDLASPRRAPVQVDHLCSLLSPPRPRLSAPWLGFTVKLNKVIPAVKDLHWRFTLSPFSWNLQYTPVVFLKFIFWLWKGLRCALFSSVAVTNGSKKQRKNKNKACEWRKVRKMDMCCTYWHVLLAKMGKQIGPFFGNKDNTLKRPICLIEFQQPQHTSTHTHTLLLPIKNTHVNRHTHMLKGYLPAVSSHS